ncbi:MAG: response regulator [Chloroflexi bacterium]|nr:response regulator [Chloroflexota bacterium]
MAERILIVEDDLETRHMMALIMRHHAYEVEEVASGAEALEAVKSRRPNLVLLDVMMPEMDGYEVTRQLRRNSATSSVGIVMITAKTHAVDRAAGLLAGADDYITKPIDPADLEQRVAAVLARSGTARKPGEMLAEIAHGAVTLLDVSLAWVFVADLKARALKSATIATDSGEEMGRQLMRRVKGGPGDISFPLAPKISPLCDALIEGASLIDKPVAAVGALPGGDILMRGLEAIGARAASIVPLKVRGQRLGVLLLAHRHEGSPPIDGARFIDLVANQAAMAIENMRLLSEIEQRESDARRTQAFHQTLVNMMGDGLVMLGPRGQVQFVNRRLLRMLGYEEGDVIGRDFVSLVHPGDRPAMQALIGRKGGATTSFEKRILRADGSPLPVLSVFVPGASTSEDVGDVLVLTDLSEQKAREAALEKRNRQLAALNHAGRTMASSLDLDAVPTTILEESVDVFGAQGGSILLIDDASGDLVFQAATGPHTERLAGVHVPVGQGIGGWVAQHAEPTLVSDVRKDPRFYRGIDQTTGLTTTSIIAAPLMIKRKVIGVLELVNKIEGVFDEDDVALLQTLAQSSAVAVDNARLYRDLRIHAVELEQAYEGLKAADKLKDELIQNVSHELRTPLTFIFGYVELIAQGELGPLTQQQAQSLQIVRNKTRALTKVVGDIVTLQRMSVTSLQKRPVAIRELAEQAVKACLLTANQAGLRVEVEAPERIPSIPADEERLSQVFDNLLGNAIKFSPNGGRIVVRVADAGAALRVEVRDSGIGISPDKLGKVFGRFYQVDGSATRRFGGTGLGLAICKEIVDAHGGKIWAESEPGKGSSFFFTLPKDPAGDGHKAN